jgi:hypothetical protein
MSLQQIDYDVRPCPIVLLHDHEWRWSLMVAISDPPSRVDAAARSSRARYWLVALLPILAIVLNSLYRHCVEDRLEDPVEEAKDEEPVNKLVGQEVIDPEDRRLGPMNAEDLVEVVRRRLVGAEGLLDRHRV